MRLVRVTTRKALRLVRVTTRKALRLVRVTARKCATVNCLIMSHLKAMSN